MKNYNEPSLENYQQKEIKPNGIVANILGLVMLIVLAPLFGFIYYKIWGGFGLQFINISIIQRILNFLVIISILVGFLLVHEMIHGIYWSKYTEVKISIILKSLYRGCYCKEPIKIEKYIMGLIMPILILGIIPLVIGMAGGHIVVLVFGLIFVIAGADDFLVIYLLRKEDKKSWIKDMDTKIGFIVYNPKK